MTTARPRAIVADLDGTLAYSCPKFTEAHLDAATVRRSLVADSTGVLARLVKRFLADEGLDCASAQARCLADALTSVLHWNSGYLESRDVRAIVQGDRVVRVIVRQAGLIGKRVALDVADHPMLETVLHEVTRDAARVVAERFVLAHQPSTEQRLALERLASILVVSACAGLGPLPLPLHAVMEPNLVDDLVYRMATWGTWVLIATGRTPASAALALRHFRRRAERAQVQSRLLLSYENGRTCETAADTSIARSAIHDLYTRDNSDAIRQALESLVLTVRAQLNPECRFDLKPFELDIVLSPDCAHLQHAVAALARDHIARFAHDLRVLSYPGHIQVGPADLHKGLAVELLLRLSGLAAEDVLALGDAEPDLPMLTYPGVEGYWVNAEHAAPDGQGCIKARESHRARANTELASRVIRAHRFGSGSAIVAGSSSLAFVTEHVERALAQLRPGPLASMTSGLWRAAAADPRNELLETLGMLQGAGVGESELRQLTRTLVGLYVDPTNPWTSSYVLSDIVAHLSGDLCGVDLAAYKHVARTRRHDTTVAAADRDFFVPEADGTVEVDLKREYQLLRRQHHEYVRSCQPAREVVARIARETNDFLQRTFCELLPRMLAAEGLSPTTEALLYFADMKSFASDFDFLYWGPAREGVRRRIIEVLSWLGVKSDPFAVRFLEDAVDQHRIDEYAYHSFNFRGRVVELGGASFERFHEQYVQRHIDLAAMWQAVRPHMDTQFAIWTGTPHPPGLRLTDADIKKLYYRATFNLLFGLAVKFGVSFVAEERAFRASLGGHLRPDEMELVFDALDLIGQYRNVYQVVTRRRWEGTLDAATRQRITHQLQRQGIADFPRALAELGARLEALRQEHFGTAVYLEGPATDIHSGAVAQARWQAVAADLRASRDEALDEPASAESQRDAPPPPSPLRSAPFPHDADFFPVLACSLDCAHCWSVGTVFDPSITRTMAAPQFERMLDILCKRGLRAITITGGEPMLWRELGAALRRLHDRGLHVRLYTHGLHCMDRDSGAISGSARRRLDEVVPYVDLLSLSVDDYHDQSYQRRFPELHEAKPYLTVVADVLKYASDSRPEIDLQVITVLGRSRGADGSWLTDDQYFEQLSATSEALESVAAGLPLLRWKLNHYRFNEGMRPPQEALCIDDAVFERLVVRLRRKLEQTPGSHLRLVRSRRVEHGYLFIRSDGCLLTLMTPPRTERYIELGSFLTGAYCNAAIWQGLRKGVETQSSAVVRQI